MKVFVAVFAGVLVYFLGSGVGIQQVDTASAQEKIPTNIQLPAGVQYPVLVGKWTGYWYGGRMSYDVELIVTRQEQMKQCSCRKIFGTVRFDSSRHGFETFPLQDAALWWQDGSFTLRFTNRKGTFKLSATNGEIKGYASGGHHHGNLVLKRKS